MRDPAAQFVRLWTRHQPEVRWYIRVMVPRKSHAEDLLQETATRLWEKFSEYDPERPFVPWAIRFAQLEVLAWRRRQARERLVFSDSLLAQLDADTEEELTQLEIRRIALEGCLQKLSEQDRHLLLKCHAEHGAVKQEAQRKKVPVRKLYYLIEKLRVGLLGCIDATLAKEGVRNG